MSFGPIQFRIAEVLLLLIIYNKKFSLGILVGTFISNILLSPIGIIDALIGTFASVIVIFLMTIVKNKYISFSFAGIVNGLVISYLLLFTEIITIDLYILTALEIFFGETVVMYSLGIPLTLVIDKNNYLKNLLIDI
jgi:uncharacterized membrane protein